MAAKPVIYLYPTEPTKVEVQLQYQGRLTATYPAYEDGWQVLVEPDGTLWNLQDGQPYSYLFWEGRSNIKYD